MLHGRRLGPPRQGGGRRDPTGSGERGEGPGPEADVGRVGHGEVVRVEKLLREVGHGIRIPPVGVVDVNGRQLGQGLALHPAGPLPAPTEEILEDSRTRRVGERPFGGRGQLEAQPDLLGAAVTVVEPPRDGVQQHRQLGALGTLGEGAAQVEGRGGQSSGIGLELHGRPQVREPSGRGNPRLGGGRGDEQPAACVVAEVLSQHAPQASHGQFLLPRGQELVGAPLELLDRPAVPGWLGEDEVPRHRLGGGLPTGQHPGCLGVRLGPHRRRHLRVHRRPLQRVAEPEGIVSAQQPEVDHRVDRRNDLLGLDLGDLGH